MQWTVDFDIGHSRCFICATTPRTPRSGSFKASVRTRLISLSEKILPDPCIASFRALSIQTCQEYSNDFNSPYDAEAFSYETECAEGNAAR